MGEIIRTCKLEGYKYRKSGTTYEKKSIDWAYESQVTVDA